ncbi:mannose/fructose/sorbose family PTS [Streptococcus sp. CCUG 71758]|nr:mannose/fructose/sorbose family PTS [Streptococcus sp. CCUG 71758]
MKECLVSFLLKLQGNSGKSSVFLIKNERSCPAPYLLLGYPKDKLVKRVIFTENSLFSMKK